MTLKKNWIVILAAILITAVLAEVIILIVLRFKSRNEYAVATPDIADTFPLKAEPMESNPQLADSDGPYVVFHTTAGDIKVVLYPEQAPKAVENFIGLAKKGYYDESLFSYVLSDKVAKAGLPKGGIIDEESEEKPVPEESLWGVGETFTDEFHDDLHHFPGALAMASEGFDLNMSQFYFVMNEEKPEDERLPPANMYINELRLEFVKEASARDAEKEMTEEELKEFEEEVNQKIQAVGTDGVPEEFLSRYQEATDRYMEVGGSYWFDYTDTVFGQIVEGYNIALAISQVKVDLNRRPQQEIKIESIEVIE